MKQIREERKYRDLKLQKNAIKFRNLRRQAKKSKKVKI